MVNRKCPYGAHNHVSMKGVKACARKNEQKKAWPKVGA